MYSLTGFLQQHQHLQAAFVPHSGAALAIFYNFGCSVVIQLATGRVGQLIGFTACTVGTR